MAVQLSAAVRTARVQVIETTIGVSAVMKILTGTMPASCAAADSGTVVATIALPSDWASSSAGVLTKTGTWSDASADATGTAGYYRIYATDGTTCHIQGTVTATGGGGDMTVDNTSFASGQTFTVTGYTLTDANA